MNFHKLDQIINCSMMFCNFEANLQCNIRGNAAVYFDMELIIESGINLSDHSICSPGITIRAFQA